MCVKRRINFSASLKLASTTMFGWLCLALCPCAVRAEYSPPAIEPNLTFLAHFDSDIRPDFSRGLVETINVNAKLTTQGKWGNALKLQNGAYMAIPAGKVVNSQAGTIMFWICPQWQDYDKSSHTFLSMQWQDGRYGYFALSSGWWEPLGSKRLYFVLNNQIVDGHCSAGNAARILQPYSWHHMVITWDSYTEHLMKIYVDGEQVASQAIKGRTIYEPGEYLYIGSDRLTPEANGRSAESFIDELAIYDRALTHKEIKVRYVRQEKDPSAMTLRKSAWLNDTTVHPRRVYSGDFEDRLLLDEDVEWALSKSAVDARLDKMKRAGFTVYVPCVWHGAGTRWLSKVAATEWTTRNLFKRDDFDPLAYAIRAAHKRGIKVFPWFTVSLRQSGENIPAHYLSRYYDSGTPKGFFNIHDPDFSGFIQGLLAEITLNYDIDGLFLDYARSGGICTSHFCIQSYKKHTGRNLISDLSIYDLSSTDRNSLDARNSIASWNESSVYTIVKRISDLIRNNKPEVKLSVYGTDADNSRLEGRNPIRWANEGTIDLIGHGDYNTELDFAAIDAEISKLINPNALFVILGNYDVNIDKRVLPRNANLLTRQIEFTKRRWPGHQIAVYFYPYLSEAQITSLSRGPLPSVKNDTAIPSRK